MSGIQSLAVTIVGGVLALASLIAITVLLANGTAVPTEFWGLLSGSSGAAGIGAAYAQGAATARRDSP